MSGGGDPSGVRARGVGLGGWQRARRGWPALALALVCAAAYAPAMRGRFIYDDHWTIVHNSALRRPPGARQLLSGQAVEQGVPDAVRPLMVLSQLLDYRIFGLDPFWFHLHSLAWHLIAVLLVWRLIGRSLGEPTVDKRSLARGGAQSIAWWCALAFAVHPIHVEPVSAINYREDLLATALLLAALTVLIPPPPADSDAPRASGWTRRALAFLATLAALAAKESALVAPLLFCALLPLRFDRAGLHRAGRALALDLAVLLAATGLYLAWRGVVVGGLDAYPALGISPSSGTSPLVDRVASQLIALWRGAAQLIVPLGLSPEYEGVAIQARSLVGMAAFVATAALALGAVAIGARTIVTPSPSVASSAGEPASGARRSPRATTHRAMVASAALILLVGWLPYAGAVALPNTRADRYFYLPALGVCLACAALIDRLARRASWGVFVGWMMIAAALATTLTQQRHWRDSWSLWSRAVATAPGSARAWGGLSRAASRRGQPNVARRALARALRLAPDSGQLQLLAGNLATRQRRFDRAERHYRRAQELGVRFEGMLLTSWGASRLIAGDLRGAEALLVRATTIRPPLALAYANLGRVLDARGERQRADDAFSQAHQLGPELTLPARRSRAEPTGSAR